VNIITYVTDEILINNSFNSLKFGIKAKHKTKIINKINNIKNISPIILFVSVDGSYLDGYKLEELVTFTCEVDSKYINIVIKTNIHNQIL
jgi:hypothetical protein